MRTNIVFLALLVCLAIAPMASANPQIRGLVASYTLENGAENRSGNGHDGTVMGEANQVDILTKSVWSSIL